MSRGCAAQSQQGGQQTHGQQGTQQWRWWHPVARPAKPIISANQSKRTNMSMPPDSRRAGRGNRSAGTTTAAGFNREQTSLVRAKPFRPESVFDREYAPCAAAGNQVFPDAWQ
ncbi:MAG: hypothetical protein NZ700_15405, partial [Gemmataceae bacterium]|nr:hypothetical protein [Gemmataceae bacterium]